MENCVIYARFSSHGQNEQSIEAQVRICSEFANNKELNIVNIFSDKARTGTNDARPEFQRMIKSAESGAFKYINVYMFDRFARNRRDSIVYKEMLKEKYGIKVLSALEPIADDEGGEFYEMFLDWNAEKYSKRLSKRVRDGLDISVANGTYCGGHLIYGYDIDLEPIPNHPTKFIKRVKIKEDEAKIIRYVYEQYDKGITKKEIADDLNAQGYRYKGKPFHYRTFDRMLSNRKYTGVFSFGKRVCDNMYSQIIDSALFERVQNRLVKNQYFAGGAATAKEPYLLVGKLFCGECGSEMISDGGTSKVGIRYYYYACKKKKKNQCKLKRREKNDLEKNVANAVLAFLSSEENQQIIADDTINYYASKTDEKNIKSLEKTISETRKKAEDLTAAFIVAKSDLLRENIEKQMQEYEIYLKDLSAQLTKLKFERGHKITKEIIIGFIQSVLSLDMNDKNYQKIIIDNLVYKVILFENDDCIIDFNFPGTTENHKNVDKSSIFSAPKRKVCIPSQSLSSRQKRIIRTPRTIRSSYYFSITITSV